MGFSSVEEFLHNIPDVVRRERNGYGSDVFKAVADSSTRHIVDLVAKTPASKSKGRKGKPKQWSRSQVRSYSPPPRHGRMGCSYGMEDDDISGYYDNDRFFDEEEDKFSDEDMMNYKNNYSPVVEEKRTINNGITAENGVQLSTDYNKESSSHINQASSLKTSTSTCNAINNNDIYTNVKEDAVKPPIPVGWKEFSQTGLNAIKCSTIAESCSGVVSRHQSLNVLSNVDLNGPLIPSNIQLNGPLIPSNIELTGPLIPTVGSYFDVVVTLAVSPQNFTVQPYMESQKLKTLMRDLNAFYKEPSNQQEAMEQSEVGDYFAASNAGGDWYRIIITKIINSQKVAA